MVRPMGIIEKYPHLKSWRDALLAAPAVKHSTVANIEAVVLVPLAEVLKQNVLPAGHLILSGILATQKEQVVQRYESLGFTLVRCEQAGEWIAPEFVLAKTA